MKIKSRIKVVKHLAYLVGASLCYSSQVLAHPLPTHIKEPTIDYGKEIFMQRCVLCHGKTGEGDGRMAKVIKSPPPFDLTASRLPDGYLKEIIVKGSEAMGRSKHMPPWGDALHDVEIESLMLHLKNIRD